MQRLKKFRPKIFLILLLLLGVVIAIQYIATHQEEQDLIGVMYQQQAELMRQRIEIKQKGEAIFEDAKAKRETCLAMIDGIKQDGEKMSVLVEQSNKLEKDHNDMFSNIVSTANSGLDSRRLEDVHKELLGFPLELETSLSKAIESLKEIDHLSDPQSGSITTQELQTSQ